MQLSKKHKSILFSASNGKCVYCGAPADSIDHIIPQSKGGWDGLRNLAPACKLCNTTKTTKEVHEFLSYRIHKHIQKRLTDFVMKQLKQEIYEEVITAAVALQKLRKYEVNLFGSVEKDPELYKAWLGDKLGYDDDEEEPT